MYNDNTIWINQSIYKHADTENGSNALIELAVITKTTDYITFNPIELSIKIISKNSNTTHMCNLNYQLIHSLISSMSEIIKNPDLTYELKSKIVKRVNSKDLVLMFISNDQGRFVLIGIKHNENDSGKIIIAYDIFVSIYDLMLEIKSNYIKMSIELPKRLPDQNIIEKLEAIERAIRVLPSNINIPELINTLSNNNSTSTNIVEEELTEDLSSSNDFEKYIEENIDKVVIPELESIDKELTSQTSLNPPQQEYNSPFIYRVLNCKSQNYEAIINGVYHEPGNSTLKFIELIRDKMNIDNFLPGISKKELKSLGYIPKVFFKSLFRKYLEYGHPIPSSSPALIKYNPINPTTENIEFAYDLILINTYIKCVRSKLEGKITDGIANYSVLYIASRCFTDILAFSFISNMNKDIVKNCVLSRYQSYKSKGFFFYFEENLKIHDCDQVSDKDISDVLDLALKIVESTENILEIHNKAYELQQLKIPSENNFELEQISNEIVDLEVNRHLGKPLEDVSNNEELIKLFRLEPIKKKSNTKSTVEYKSNLHRFVNEPDFLNQVPERHKEIFEAHIIEISETLQSFDYSKIPMEELGDDIVKAIYIWNTCDKKERYTSYRTRIEECMSKDLVIAQIKGIKTIEDNTGSEEGSWL